MSERASERAWLVIKLFELCYVRFVLLWFVIAFLFVFSFCGVELDEATFGNYCLNGFGILAIPSKDCPQLLKKDVKIMQNLSQVGPKLFQNIYNCILGSFWNVFGAISRPGRLQGGPPG